MMNYRECRFTAQDGLSLYYRQYGDPLSPNAPVLCLPGLARNSKDYHRFASRISRKRWVVTPDYRGRGQSDYDSDANNYQAPTYIGDIHHLLAATGMHRAVVVGTSMGGLLAMAMGAAMPSALAGVVINDIGPDIGGPGIGRIMDYLSKDNPQPDWNTAVETFKRMFPTLSFQTESEWREAAGATWREDENGQLRYDWDIKIIEPALRGKPLPDLWALFRSLRRLPVLAIRGGASDVLSAETFDRMAEEHPDLQRICLDGIGHVPSLIEDASTDAVDEFLSRI